MADEDTDESAKQAALVMKVLAGMGAGLVLLLVALLPGKAPIDDESSRPPEQAPAEPRPSQRVGPFEGCENLAFATFEKRGREHGPIAFADLVMGTQGCMDSLLPADDETTYCRRVLNGRLWRTCDLRASDCEWMLDVMKSACRR